MGDISKNFNRSEFACKDRCGFDTVDCEQIIIVQDVRDYFGPTRINSGCRCRTHNINSGGSIDSQHMYAKATDLEVIALSSQDAVADYLEAKYPNKYGIGRYHGRTHIDPRPIKTRWDNRNLKFVK